MRELFLITAEHALTRRSVVRYGVRLAYAAPLITASFGLTPLLAGAADAISSEKAADAAEAAAKQNTPPVAVTGDGFEVVDANSDGFETVTIDGSASADPDGKIVSYQWTLKNKRVSSNAVATV